MKLIKITVFSILLLALLPLSLAFSGGNGTAGNPWQISTPQDYLDMLNMNGSSDQDYFEVTNDINMSSLGVIQPTDLPQVNLDGKSHVITDMTMNTTFSGQFDHSYAVIENIGYTNVDFLSSGFDSGFLISDGTNSNFTVRVVFVEGKINGTSGDVGSLTADTWPGDTVDEITVEDYYFIGNVTAPNGQAGGFLQSIGAGTFKNIYVVANEPAWIVTQTTTERVASAIFFNEDTAGTISGGGSFKTTVQLKDITTFNSSYNITEGHDPAYVGAKKEAKSVWGIDNDTNEGYPYFQTFNLPQGTQDDPFDLFECARINSTLSNSYFELSQNITGVSYNGPGFDSCLSIVGENSADLTENVVFNLGDFSIRSSQEAIGLQLAKNITINNGVTGEVYIRETFVDDLTMNGTKIHLDTNGDGIKADGSSGSSRNEGLVFENISVITQGPASDIMFLSNKVDVIVYNSYFNGRENGIFLTSDEDTIVAYNNVFEGLTNSAGTKLFLGTNSAAYNNTFRGAGKDIFVRSSNNTIYENFLEGTTENLVVSTSGVVEVYNNTFSNASIILSAVSGTEVTFYNNLVNSTGNFENETVIQLNKSTVGNTWTNPAGTGFSDTCTNDWFNNCEENNIIGNSTDFHAVALSEPIPLEVNIIYPSNDSQISNVSKLVEFSLNEASGTNNSCFAAIDGEPGKKFRLADNEASGTWTTTRRQDVIATGNLLAAATSPHSDNAAYEMIVRTEDLSTEMGRCVQQGGDVLGTPQKCIVPVTPGETYDLSWNKLDTGNYFFRMGTPKDPNQVSTVPGFAFAMETFFVNITEVSFNSTGEINLTEKFIEFNNDAQTHNVEVTCYDDEILANINDKEHEFTVFDLQLLPLEILGNYTCPSKTPNEDNLPVAAKFQVNFSVFKGVGFLNTKLNLTLNNDGQEIIIDESDCTYNQVDSSTRDYSCNVTMNYWYKSGDYDVQLDAEDDGQTASDSSNDLCTYGQLLASERTVDTISFPGAGPGIDNVAGTPGINIRNTGNVDFNVSIVAKSLVGRTDPSQSLVGSQFKSGLTLPSATILQSNVEKDLGVAVDSGENAFEDIFLWLSMPQSQNPQEYYTPDAWELKVTG